MNTTKLNSYTGTEEWVLAELVEPGFRNAYVYMFLAYFP